MTTEAPIKDPKDKQKLSLKARARSLLENSAFFSTVIVGIVAIFAYKATLGQLDTARLQLIATDRPWIKIKTIDNVKLMFDRDSVRIDGVVEFENIGKSPALNVETIYELAAENVYVLPKDVTRFCQYGRGADDFYGNALFPQDILREHVFNADIEKRSIINKLVSDARAQAMKKKDSKGFDPKKVKQEVSSFALIVCARYNIDQDKRRHYTAQVYSIGSKSALSSTGLPKGNSDFDLNRMVKFDQNSLSVSTPKENRYAN